jgi:hypothetical protein
VKVSRLRFAQLVLVLNALSYTATGLALLLAPEWFYANIGTFPPFSRHYSGDLGGFLVALGLGLFFAVPRQSAHVALLFVAALGGTIHAANHAVDAARGIGGWDQTLALAVLAVLTITATWIVASR